MKFKYEYSIMDSVFYNLSDVLLSRLDCSDHERGELEEIKATQDRLKDTICDLIEMLYDNKVLTKEQLLKFVPAEYSEVEE